MAAKRSNKRPVRSEKDQLGCMSGLISMFDFRHGRTTQRLLSDRRRSNRNIVGVGNSENTLDTLTTGNDCSKTMDGEGKTTVTVASKLSVKKLLEEEMSGQQVAKNEVKKTEVQVEQLDSEQGDNGRKNRRRKSKNRKKSSGNSIDLDAAENLVSEGSCQHQSMQLTASDLEIDKLMEEFCRQIHQKRINCVNHDQPAEAHMQPNQKNSSFEERLSEAIKFLVSQKLNNRNQLMEDGELQASKEVMDALQILNLDEELFLKLLRDPNSVLLKDVQDLPDAPSKDKQSKSLVASNLSEQEPVGSRQSIEPVNRKQRNFFRRKPKTQERNLTDGDKVSQASNKIVILKPGPTCLQAPETGSSLGSPAESRCIIKHREPNEKVGSHFFLAEIKRKLKHAMGREQHKIPSDGISKRLPGQRQNSRDNRVKESIGMNSPTKDHFFVEKIARPSFGVKKGEKTSKLKGSELGIEYETTDFSRQRASNIYIEAKKHLSEMLTNGDENEDFSNRRVPKTLGKILSLPEYNMSPLGSPGRNLEPNIITAQTRLNGSENFQKVNENNQHNNVSPLSQVAENTKCCISDNKSSDEVQVDNAISNNIDICLNDDKEDQKFCSTKEEMSSEDAVIIVKETKDEITSEGAVIIVEETGMLHEESELLVASSETSDSSTARDDKNVNRFEVCNEKEDPQCLKEDLSEEEQQQISPLASPSNTSATKKVGLESVNDMQERPSPVSVLEPILSEDVISPSSIRSHSGETSIQPRRISFEEHGSLARNDSKRIKTCMDDKESVLEYIKALLQGSSLKWDELYIRSLSSDQFLDPLLLDEVQYLPNQLCHDKKLLFDCLNEVLMEFCEYHFGSPGISFIKPNTRPIPDIKNTMEEVWQGVYWHLLPMPLPRTLDQIVRKDMSRTGTWMDLRLDTDCIGVEMSEAIVEDLVEDTITSCIIENLQCEYHDVPSATAEGLQE